MRNSQHSMDKIYLLMISSPNIDSVAMSLYDIKMYLSW